MKPKYYFVAAQENNYQPWITSATAMAMFCVIAWGLRILILPAAFTGAASGIDAMDLMIKVNQERTNRYIPALKIDDRLTSAASAKSGDMIARSFFGHVDPDGKYVWPKIEASGYKPYQTLGENLAMDFTTSGGVVAGWMNSPGHRANLLNEKFEDQGMAAIYGLYEPNHYSTLVTNLFGTLSKKTETPSAPSATIPPKTTPATKSSAVINVPPAVTSQPQAPSSTPATQVPPAEIKIVPVPAAPSAPISNNLPATIPGSESTPPPYSPPSGETQLYFALRLIFTIFAGCYVFFLILDSALIYRAKVKRTNAPASPHTLLFVLFALVNLFTLYI